MEIEYSLSVEDRLAFHEYHNSQSPTLRRQQAGGRCVVSLALLLIGLVLCLALGPSGRVVVGGGFAILAAISFFTFPKRWSRRAQRVTGRIYTEGDTRQLLCRRRMTITPEALTDATELSVLTMKWAAVESIVVYRRYVFFCAQPLGAQIVPGSAFGSDFEFEKFVETARRYYREARRV